ncbi:MAG TPA: outer-membrane lipoprotein carrier protein LolA [Blastocatellia bacterium]|nr:outer-membrane lipoprotein carrier protein LolA [Blastocatellia bacterium]
MKRISANFIIAVLFLSVSIRGAKADGKLDQILANMQTAGSKISTLFANMEETDIKVEMGGKPSRSAAKIYFKHKGKDDKVRLNYSRPEGQTVLVLGDKIYLVQARIKQVTETTRRALASKDPEMSFVASPYKSVPQLKSQYNIEYLGDESGQAKLRLTPKAKSKVKQVTLWVDQSMWLPVKYETVSSNGDVSTITLSGLQVNGVISDRQFNKDWPSDFKVVKP